ncbi:hypothetical protein OKW21_002193 [Catalinimonas alkaloidigena]|uniref:hypothetical protein n=1 Tax=Catalinimonas alkaloidigena TaxID=1075417 RepID=UPI002407315D|nr:hypothetical protein [Catalinimonas alkaloidigena]MDF9796930.1 hypothetical protein [Catalinimonas alkaloidigena]
MNTLNNYDDLILWKRRLDEWKTKVIEQQHFHENVSSHLKHVYSRAEKHTKSEVLATDR